MSHAVTRLIDSRSARLTLVAVVSLLTIVLAPMLEVGLIGGALHLRSEGWFSVFVVACGGLLGISSAWARVLVGGQRLCRLPSLRWSICFGLFLGIAVAIFLVSGFLAAGWVPQSGNLVPLAYLSAGIVGVLLLVGTVWLQPAPAI